MQDLIASIVKLKQKYHAVILAHNYQLPEIQDIADFVGDSLDLSRTAAATSAATIVFCGVRFMAETAALLSPEKKVLLPDLEAGCPLADMITPEKLQHFKRQFDSELPVVAYINTSAAIKAQSNICCTSSNALKVIESLPQQEAIFIPDKSLGNWAAAHTAKKLHLFQGFCPTHSKLWVRDLEAAKSAHPNALVLSHPECSPEIISLSNYVGGTMGMLQYIKTSSAQSFIVATETGILHRMRKENPGKFFFPASERMVCPNMKRITLEKVLWALQEQDCVITVPQEYRKPALQAITKMLELN